MGSVATNLISGAEGGAKSSVEEVPCLIFPAPLPRLPNRGCLRSGVGRRPSLLCVCSQKGCPPLDFQRTLAYWTLTAQSICAPGGVEPPEVTHCML